jgi:hypothetical protein
MVYLCDARDQKDFCHQQLLRKMRRKISWTDGRTDRGKTVYPPPPSGSGDIKIFTYLEVTFKTWNSKRRQMSKTQWAQHITVSNSLFSQAKYCVPTLLYTCLPLEDMLRSYHAFLCLALNSQIANFDKLPLSQYRKYMGKGVWWSSNFEFSNNWR